MKKYSIYLILISACIVFSCAKTDFKKLSLKNRICPVLLEIHPTTAKFGETIELMGQNFLLENSSDYHISINGLSIDTTAITWIDNQTLQVMIPKGVGSGLVEVNFEADPCIVTSTVHFEYEFTAMKVENFKGELLETTCGNCLNNPTGIDVDNAGNVVVADKDHFVVKVYNSNGTETSLIGELDSNDCNDDSFGTGDRLSGPFDVVIHPTLGIIYIADNGCRSIKIVESGMGNKRGMSTFVGQKDTSGCISQNTNFSNAIFTKPKGLAFVSHNHILVADEFCNRIFSADKTSGAVGFEAGTNLSGDGLESLKAPAGIDFYNTDELLFIADRGNKRIIQKKQGSSKILAGMDGTFNEPKDVAFDNQNTVYVTDSGNHRIYSINLDGTISIIAGNGNRGFATGSDNPLNAEFDSPEGIAYDKTNNFIYVADTKNHLIRRIILE